MPNELSIQLVKLDREANDLVQRAERARRTIIALSSVGTQSELAELANAENWSKFEEAVTELRICVGQMAAIESTRKHLRAE